MFIDHPWAGSAIRGPCLPVTWQTKRCSTKEISIALCDACSGVAIMLGSFVPLSFC
jgi:hypothetical protein